MMQLNEIMQALNKEIEWCNDNPDPAFHAEYRKGFVNGLIQAKYLISEVSKLTKESKKRTPEEIQERIDDNFFEEEYD